MFKRLLLPLDLTAKHDIVVHTAAELAKHSGGSVTLLHVIELIPGFSREEEQAFYDRLDRSAQNHLDQIGETLAAQNVPCQVVIQYGNRVQETLRYAEQNHCDLILLTSPAFDPEKPAIGWSSLSFKFSVLARIPILLVKA